MLNVFQLEYITKAASFQLINHLSIYLYALVIFITLSVLMIFSNLTFPDAKQSGVQLVLEIQRFLGVQIRDHSSRSEIGMKR